jgi:uncharacterized protein YdhG (YjbR/CyaY superfamily)
MATQRVQFATTDDYIASFDTDTRKVLEQVRATIKKAAPGADETINYGMPTFTLNGNLVHFAAFKGHIGFYPTPSAISAFNDEISKYTWAKGSVQFPLDKPMPFDLITRIVEFRVKEASEKKKKK